MTAQVYTQIGGERGYVRPEHIEFYQLHAAISRAGHWPGEPEPAEIAYLNQVRERLRALPADRRPRQTGTGGKAAA